jgi:hypothetical protein
LQLQNEGRDDVLAGGGEGGRRVSSQLGRGETTYLLEVEREGDASDCSCDNKMRVGTTYELEVEREGNVSDCSCDYKMRAGMTY